MRWKSRIPSNVSGQVNYDETGKNVGRRDMEAQMCQAYTNIHKVRAQYGATMKILTDIPVLVIQIEKLSDNKSVLGWKQMKNWKSNSGAVMKSALLKA
jgi:enamine deaminase RidA (YjgF/YER057c/UK114 family)